MLKKIVLILSFSIFLVGCTHDKNREEITFSSWGSITEVGILKKVINDFEKENPNIKINFLHIPQNYFQKIHLLFASNNAPDVLFMNNLFLPIYASQLEDLTDLIHKEDFYKQSIDGMSNDGKVLGIPRDISNLLLYVNLDKMQLPSTKWTLENLLEQAMLHSANNIFGVGAENDIYWMTPYLSYYGGGILDDKNNLIIDSKESQRAIEFYNNLIYKHRVAPMKSQIGSSTLAQMFLDEKIIMYLSGRWLFPKIAEEAKFEWAVINFPYGKNLQFCDVSGWVISKNSQHKESAKKFVKFLSSKENSMYFAQTGLIVPANIEASKLLNKNAHNEKVFLEVIKYTQTTPVNKNYKKLTDNINKNIFK